MKPTYTLHKLPEGFIVTSNEEILPNTLYMNNGVLFTSDSVYNEGNNPNNSNPRVTNHNFKVVAQQEQIDFSALSEEGQKEIGWFDVEGLADCYAKGRPIRNRGLEKDGWVATGFVHGFQKAVELLSDRRFTLTDVEKAIQMSRTLIDGKSEFEVEDILGSADGTYGVKVKYLEKQIIQSLSQPKSWTIECIEEYGKIKITKIL